MATQKAIPSDPALWEDSFLRPWTIDEELDKKIADENLRLDDCIQKTSGSKIAGVRGQSELDQKPAQFLDFEKFVSNPGWLYRLGSDEMDAEDEKLFHEMVSAAQAAVNAETDSLHPETNNLALINPDDKLLLNSILEFNHALYAGASSNGLSPMRPTSSSANDKNSLRAKAEAFQQYIDLRASMRKSKIKKKRANPAYSLKGIKYSPLKNPKVLNVSTVEFQSLMQRFNMTMPGTFNKSKSAPQLLNTLQNVVENRLSNNNNYSVRPGADAPSSSSIAVAANTATGGAADTMTEAETAQRGRDMDALTQFLEKSGLMSSPAPASAAPAPGNQSPVPQSLSSIAAAAMTGLAPVPEHAVLSAKDKFDNDLLRPATSPASQPQMRPPSSSLLLRGTEFSVGERALLTQQQQGAAAELPTSPIQRASSARPASRAELDPSSPSARSPALLLHPISASPGSPSKHAQSPTPRHQQQQQHQQQRPSTSQSTSEARVVARLSTPALSKLTISPSTGTTVSGNAATMRHSLSKAKLREIRTLRDQLMSTSGSLAMNVHPEASPDAQADAKESVRVTQEMVRETIEKNRVDQTWTLLATPGFYEAVGPDEIFKAESALATIVNDKFLLSVKNADVSQGIKRDPLRVWSEDGVKNKIKIFQSGGSMKM